MMKWRQRRQQRFDMAVFGVIVSRIEGCFYTEIQREIGSGAGRIYPALDRLERSGLVDRETVTSGWQEGRTLYFISSSYSHGPGGIWDSFDRRQGIS